MRNVPGYSLLGRLPLPHLVVGMVAVLVLSLGLVFQQATPAHATDNATIRIVKLTNGIDTGDNGPGPEIPVCGQVTWTYFVSIVETSNVYPVTMDKVFNASGTGSGVVDDGGPNASFFPTYVGGDNADPRLEIGEVWEFTASGTPILGPYLNTVTATGYSALDSSQVTASDVSHYTGVPCGAIDIEKYVLVQPDVPQGDLCDTFGKPQKLTIKYTGDGDDATHHSQDAGKVVVVGDPNDATPVKIKVTDKSDPNSATAKVFFNGQVNLGDTFLINSMLAGSSTLPANSYAYVYSLGGTLLQTVLFHTSCSQPMILGDQYGSLMLVGFQDSTGGGSSLPPPPSGPGEDADTAPGPSADVGSAITWSYVVTNTGGVALSNVVVTDDQGVAVTCPENTLAVGESMTCTGHGTAVAGQYANVGTATGTPPVGGNVSDSDPAHYFGVVTPVNSCSGDVKPKVLTMKYTGDGNDATHHSQALDKVVVVGDPNDDPQVYIIATDKDNPNDSKAKIWFKGLVNLNGTFGIDATNAGATRLSADTRVFIYEQQGGTQIQFVKFHTSCSQPLFLGDQYGGIQLVGFTAE